MVFGLLLGVVLLGVIAFGVVRTARRVREEAARGRRGVRNAVRVVVALGVIAAVVVLAIAVVKDLSARNRPVPEFSSLADAPDPSLKGTVAYISEAKSASAGRQACARVVAASGESSKDALCWPINESALATAVWRSDGRLLVTAFDAPEGKKMLVPQWAKIVDVESGRAEDVPQADLGENARPPTGPAANPEGERLVRTGKNGNAKIELTGESGSRTIFSVKDANPDWGIQSGPMWSPDFKWVLMWDGTRLLLTTVDHPSTKVLAAEASGGVFNYDVPTFAIAGGNLGLP